MYLIVLLALFTGAFSVRGAMGKRKPVLRMKPGESPEEARLVLLGTYRAYSWALWIAVGEVVFSGAFGVGFPSVLRWVGAITGLLVLIFAHALYWRLGYGGRRWILILGHVSGLFALGECHYVLRQEIASVAPEQAQTAGGDGV